MRKIIEKLKEGEKIIIEGGVNVRRRLFERMGILGDLGKIGRRARR